ncbi:hypothetical protein MXD59_21345 [Frankia sp. Ag45/Mut15]|uniref:PrgI family protein n=1 Tax=Frankia umida TaxID=573489 RepID=A0ABT0K3E3_9ACTN|nr:SCO6880 family protein [Frankia umida]MCK9878284.1 hypothetical protein [Frankia umida]
MTDSSPAPTYRLARRRQSGSFLGLQVGPLSLLVFGLISLLALPLLTGSVLAGVAVAAGCCLVALLPAPGGPAHQVLPLAARQFARRASGRDRWWAPLPAARSTANESRRGGQPAVLLPPVLAGLEIVGVARSAAAGATDSVAPIGVVRDRRLGTMSVLISARGTEIVLLDPADQHQRLGAWSAVLANLTRDSTVVQLGWSLCSAPASFTAHRQWLAGRQAEHPAEPQHDQVAAHYEALLDQISPALADHDLRLWVTIDTRRLPRHADPAEAAVTTASTLLEQCRSAGLVAGAPDSPVAIAEAFRIRADPGAVGRPRGARRGLAEHAGLASPLAGVHAGPLSLLNRWDAVLVDDVWHRMFWVTQWPGSQLQPGWLDPLLFEPDGMHTLAILCEPISSRASRRRITSDAVQVESAVAARERYGFRVPTHLASAQTAVDQREVELQSGHAEFGYLALAGVAAHTLEELDEASRRLMDRAAQTGITELRALHGRHDRAWAASLPGGRAPSQGLRDAVR